MVTTLKLKELLGTTDCKQDHTYNQNVQKKYINLYSRPSLIKLINIHLPSILIQVCIWRRIPFSFWYAIRDVVAFVDFVLRFSDAFFQVITTITNVTTVIYRGLYEANWLYHRVLFLYIFKGANILRFVHVVYILNFIDCPIIDALSVVYLCIQHLFPFPKAHHILSLNH